MAESQKRLLFTLTWHKAVLCIGLAALAFLTVVVPWKGHGYGFIWHPIGNGGVELARQVMPMLFIIMATGGGVYLTWGLAPKPVWKATPNRAKPDPEPPAASRQSPESSSSPDMTPDLVKLIGGLIGVGLAVIVIVILMLISGSSDPISKPIRALPTGR